MPVIPSLGRMKIQRLAQWPCLKKTNKQINEKKKNQKLHFENIFLANSVGFQWENEFPCGIPFLFCLGGTGVWTQDLIHFTQALYHWSHSTSPLLIYLTRILKLNLLSLIWHFKYDFKWLGNVCVEEGANVWEGSTHAFGSGSCDPFPLLPLSSSGRHLKKTKFKCPAGRKVHILWEIDLGTWRLEENSKLVGKGFGRMRSGSGKCSPGCSPWKVEGSLIQEFWF
jgi:hypothetical protein